MIKNLINLQIKARKMNIMKNISYFLLIILSFWIAVDIKNTFIDIISISLSFLAMMKFVFNLGKLNSNETFLNYFFNVLKPKNILNKIDCFLDKFEDVECLDRLSFNDIKASSFDIIQELLNYDLKIRMDNKESAKEIKKQYDYHIDLLLYNQTAYQKPNLSLSIKNQILENQKILYLECRNIIKKLAFEHKDIKHLDNLLSEKQVKEIYALLDKQSLHENTIELDILKQSKEMKNSLTLMKESKEKKYLSL